ncbi:MAG: hypothetical protein ABSA91_10820, partial [Acidimicrobiales bacterium]
MRTPLSLPALVRWPRRAVAVFVSVATISGFIALSGPLGLPTASAIGDACAPQVMSVSAVSAAQTQTVTITGTCFGSANYQPDGDTDSGSFAITDVDPPNAGAWWQACFENNQSSPNDVTCSITAWSDTSITFSGFTGGYNTNDWFLTAGDAVVISVWNSDTVGTADPIGPANCIVTVGGGATDCSQPAQPSSPSTTTASALSAANISLGGSVTDTAVVTGQTTPGSKPSGDPLAGIPAGTVNFYVCGPVPSPQLCTSTSSLVGPESLNSSSPGSDDFATATSPSFTPQVAGTYCFAAIYGGGGIYDASSDNSSGT